jgi:hypothetical protein
MPVLVVDAAEAVPSVYLEEGGVRVLCQNSVIATDLPFRPR